MDRLERLMRVPSYARRSRSDRFSVLIHKFSADACRFERSVVLPSGNVKPLLRRADLEASCVAGGAPINDSSILASIVVDSVSSHSLVSYSSMFQSSSVTSTIDESLVVGSVVASSFVERSHLSRTHVFSSALSEVTAVNATIQSSEVSYANSSNCTLRGVKLSADVWIHDGEWTGPPVYLDGPTHAVSECTNGRVHIGCWCFRPPTFRRHKKLFARLLGDDFIEQYDALLEELLVQVGELRGQNE